MSLYEGRLFINGELKTAKSGETFPLHSPVDGRLLANVSRAAQEDVDAAVEAAEKAQPAWAATPAKERARKLRKFADLIEKNKAKLANLDTVAMGKPLTGALADVDEARDFTYFMAGLTESGVGQTSLNSPKHVNITLREPFGVVASIIPWNFPTNIWTHDVCPAIGAGNAMILKGSEKAPLSSIFLGQLCHEAGFPPGIVQIVNGAGDTGALLSSHMRIRKISFTGSTNAGKSIMSAAAKSNIKDVSLELGGKSPLVVFADADLEHAARLAAFSFTFNSGQVCTASTRLYIEKSAADEFKKLLIHAVKKFNLGDPSNKDTDLGPQVDKVQSQNVRKFLDIGRKDGKALIGGEAATNVGPNYINPTVFTDLGDDSDVSRLEIFGPVLALHEFDGEQDAITKANDTNYGLYATVFSNNVARALRVARALQAGTVGVNVASPYGAYELPFGGYKASGIGRQKGNKAVEHWTQEKTVYLQHEW
ncbi:hypothetical protein V2G26_018089 [Clonostachys chloroleuca]